MSASTSGTSAIYGYPVVRVEWPLLSDRTTLLVPYDVERVALARENLRANGFAIDPPIDTRAP